MLISHDWLEAFVPHGRTPDEVRDLISGHVATVDAMERLREDLREIVVARVVHAARHPNADALWVTKVDDGSGTLLDVVCGAPNVSEGMLYPFVRAGATLPGGMKIERRRIRGETSNGMLCSPRELGLGEDHSGIMALSVEVAPGTPFLDALPVGDTRYDVDVLPNRPDLLSHLGMARELSALTGAPIREPAEVAACGYGVPAAKRAPREGRAGGVSLRLEDAEGCPRYMGVTIRGVRVAPSPDWLVRRLQGVGLRPISNVVDVTNYFLHGYGQPMHAFDVDRLAGSAVVVRPARNGERLLTLDGVERTLDAGMTVIADATRAVAVAGVIGGRDSEVTEQTANLFLEVAWFAPRSVRRTRRTLGITTDASYRFERGIDPQVAPFALARAAAMIVAVAGGQVEGTPIDVGEPPASGRPVRVDPARVAGLIGDDIPASRTEALLRSVGFDVQPATGGTLQVAPPSWRNDVSGEADIIEEVARLHGYDRLSDILRPFRPGTVPDHPLHVLGHRIREALVGEGMVETRPMPFVRGEDATHVRVRNPLAEDEPHLRTSLLETLGRRAEYNLSRMQGNIRIFEIGSAFAPCPGRLPLEEVRVGALIMGLRRPPHFTEPRPPAIDRWDARALAERISALAYPGAPVRLESGASESPVLWTVHGGADGAPIGRIVRMALDRPPWSAAPFGIEITLRRMPNADVAPRGRHAEVAVPAPVPARVRQVRPLPTTPAAEFDLALLLPAGARAADVERVIRTTAGPLLERLTVFDEYRGAGLPDGMRSVAWRLTFRDPSRTLRDKEIEGRRQRILKALESECGVRLRPA